MSPFLLYNEHCHKNIHSENYKIPKSYFLAFDNLINSEMLKSIVDPKSKDKQKFFSLFEENFKSSGFHGDFHEDYLKSKTPFNALKKFIGFSNKYFCDYQVELASESKDKLVVCYKKQNKVTLDNYCQGYNQVFLKNICRYGLESSSNIKVEEREDGGDRNFYEVLTA